MLSFARTYFENQMN